MQKQDLLIVGRVRTVFGVQGWLKVESYTDPAANLLEYGEWHLKVGRNYQRVQVDQSKVRNKDLVVHLKGLDDRDKARQYSQALICVPREVLPTLDKGDYYWHQLEGLSVYQAGSGDQVGQLLGEVAYLLETGANDVLVVKRMAGDQCSQQDSQSSSEILIPYLPGTVVKQVDLALNRILVDWSEDWQ